MAWSGWHPGGVTELVAEFITRLVAQRGRQQRFLTIRTLLRPDGWSGKRESRNTANHWAG
jgi:hypothetical protein